MASSSSPTESLGSIEVSGPLGTEITLRNERLTRVGFGVRTLCVKNLRPGAYLIEYRLLEALENETVYLAPGGKMERRAPSSLVLEGVAPTPRAADWENASFLSRPLVARLAAPLFLVGRPSPLPEQAAAPMRIEVRTLRGVPLDVYLAQTGAWLKGVGALPGRYALRCTSGDQFNERVIPVFDGRRTAIFIAQDHNRPQRFGMTPEKMTVATFASDAAVSEEAIANHLAWMEIATASLARDRIGFDAADLEAGLAEPDIDPLKLLFIAAHALAALNRARRPAVGESADGRLGGAEIVEQLLPTEKAIAIGAEALRRLSSFEPKILAKAPYLSDAVAMARWMHRRFSINIEALTFRTISEPPLLALSYALALEESVDDPASLPDGTLAAAAGLAQAGSSPWFSWREKIEGAQRPSKTPSRTDIERAGRILRDLVVAVRQPSRRARAGEAKAAPIARRGLGERVRHGNRELYQAISKILAIRGEQLVDVRTGALITPTDALKRVAAEMRLPAANLVRDLTEIDVEAFIADAFSGQVGSARQGAIFAQRRAGEAPDAWKVSYDLLIQAMREDPGYSDIRGEDDEREPAPDWTLRTLQDRLVRRATGDG